MNEQKRQEIALLAGIAYDKQVKLNNCRMRNVANLNYEDMKQAMVDTELARAEYYEACSTLAAAMPSGGDVQRVERMFKFWGEQAGDIHTQVEQLFGPSEPAPPGTYQWVKGSQTS